jgi:hypothetical protein
MINMFDAITTTDPANTIGNGQSLQINQPNNMAQTILL